MQGGRRVSYSTAALQVCSWKWRRCHEMVHAESQCWHTGPSAPEVKQTEWHQPWLKPPVAQRQVEPTQYMPFRKKSWPKQGISSACGAHSCLGCYLLSSLPRMRPKGCRQPVPLYFCRFWLLYFGSLCCLWPFLRPRPPLRW